MRIAIAEGLTGARVQDRVPTRSVIAPAETESWTGFTASPTRAGDVLGERTAFRARHVRHAVEKAEMTRSIASAIARPKVRAGARRAIGGALAKGDLDQGCHAALADELGIGARGCAGHARGRRAAAASS
jgi:hypothetical protein